MIVQCPRCEARYRVEEELLQEEPTFKCSRCGHVFSYEPPTAFSPDDSVASPPPSAEGDLSPSKEREEESLVFPFAESGRRPADDEREEQEEAPDGEEETVSAPDEDHWFDEADAGEEEDDSAVEEESEAGDAPRIGEEPRFVHENVPDESSSPEPRSPSRPILIFLAAILLVYGNLALYLRNNVAVAEAHLGDVPLLGSFLSENRLLRSQVVLEDLQAAHRTTKDGTPVLVLSGQAVNGSSRSLRHIQVEGRLYDGEGEAVGSRTIYCGNAVSLKIVENVSSKELDILQKLQPPQRFSIDSGGTAGFSIVFLEPPENVQEFGARVVSARPTDS